MANSIAHFAINCDDLDRAQQFYGKVFGWTFKPWGPPGFLQVDKGAAEQVQGAMQKRREIVPGLRMTGPECTFSVEDIDATVAAVEASGGKIVMPKATIPTVGTLIFFQDPEGNIAGAMQYEKK